MLRKIVCFNIVGAHELIYIIADREKERQREREREREREGGAEKQTDRNGKVFIIYIIIV